MQTDSKTTAEKPRGLFARIFGRVRSRLRRIFGKDEAPNIYPFF